MDFDDEKDKAMKLEVFLLNILSPLYVFTESNKFSMLFNLPYDCVIGFPGLLDSLSWVSLISLELRMKGYHYIYDLMAGLAQLFANSNLDNSCL